MTKAIWTNAGNLLMQKQAVIGGYKYRNAHKVLNKNSKRLEHLCTFLALIFVMCAT